ncbi:MAG: hypothetical protein ACK5D7_07615 [Planctomycetota bacterium]
MNSRFCFFAYYILWFLFFGNVCLGQGRRDRAEKAAMLMEMAKSQSFDELMDSISRNDNGSFDVIRSVRLDPSCFRHSDSIFQGTIYDPRVRKLYELSTKMTKEQAAAKIESAFRKKFTVYKKEGGVHSEHGLHSTLFLASEFCSRDAFNELCFEWVDFSRSQLLAREYKKGGEDLQARQQFGNDAIKELFLRSKSPELLMFSSLVLNNQIRQGKTEEEAIEILRGACAKAGWAGDLPTITLKDIPPLDGNESVKPLARIAMFEYWPGFGSADVDMQIKLIDAARYCLAPPGIIGEAMKAVEEAALDGIRKVDQKEDRDRVNFKDGTRFTFGGKDVEFRVFRKWIPSKSPKKAEAISELDRMIAENIPEAMREDWEGPVAEAKKWINEVPETGTDKSVPIRKRWPEVKAESDAERPEEPEYWIELEVVDASSLSGPPKKASEKDGDGKSDK